MDEFYGLAVHDGSSIHDAGHEVLTAEEWVFRKTEKTWVSFVEARSDTDSATCGDEMPIGVVFCAPKNISDVVGPSVVSQFISGAAAFGVEIELLEREVDIVGVCHAADFNESPAESLIDKDNQSLQMLRSLLFSPSGAGSCSIKKYC